MNNQVYPGSTAQFRILRNNQKEDKLQLRYINITQGYVSMWQDVPIIIEDKLSIELEKNNEQ